MRAVVALVRRWAGAVSGQPSCSAFSIAQAFDTDVTIRTLSRIERGLSRPALATVAKIADARAMPLLELVRAEVVEQIDGEEVRRYLEAYAHARMDRDADGIAELVGVIDRARASGLGADTIAVLACDGRAA